ncbi:cytochrome P450 [Methylobacterium radiodurans]|uniref:Cytochrome P450 n=1 Tax=Methylobacterium radiodurans TaxID=2202828 RepID=A0A2U8VWI2_9HYPH|nr:cytochrome P450 [Methylobacterium radiodurans]AWN37562.1 cytochrome P450 [Methylobacterium radiodurans]
MSAPLATARRASLPRTGALDSSLALLREGYAFIPNRCRALGSDLFATRLMLSPVTCMTGAEAAARFYDGHRFTRRHALPAMSFALIQDQGSVMVMDGAAHLCRKAMFLGLVGAEALERLAAITLRHWRAAADGWARAEAVVLLDEAHRVLTAAVCEWVGLPLEPAEVAARAAEFAAMIDGTGAIGPRNWRGHLYRARTERWARAMIREIRAGRRAVPEGAARAIAEHRDRDGEPLGEAVAAVELINVLRPTVANARYVVFAAMALHQAPALRPTLQEAAARRRFALEVRRFYPFIPFIGGRVQEPFRLQGHDFRTGDWVLMDLYGTNRDPRLWPEPERFDPERFRDAQPGAFALVSHGGGSAAEGHRCPGEGISQILLEVLSGELACLAYRVPEQNLSLDLAHIPARPESGFVIRDVVPG